MAAAGQGRAAELPLRVDLTGSPPFLDRGETHVRIDGPQVLLEPNAAQSIAVILHELATNAAIYGALSSAKGQIDLSWSHESDGRLELRWTEAGGPPVQMPTREGFGGRIIKQMTEQLRGTVRFDWRAGIAFMRRPRRRKRSRFCKRN